MLRRHRRRPGSTYHSAPRRPTSSPHPAPLATPAACDAGTSVPPIPPRRSDAAVRT
ncbi:hypothetical protein B0H19DRAFT_1122807 [Mycena capillaripes]|nr:hypothetical protein B0H19DRAFT_1122807 [Mycena capillaripes]